MKQRKNWLFFICVLCLTVMMRLPVSAEESSEIAIQSLSVTKPGYDGELTPYVEGDKTYAFTYAYDNDSGTRMSVSCASATAWGAMSDDSPVCMTADLGAVYELDKVAVSWLTNGNKRAYKYDISVSTDGTDYTKVVTRSGDAWRESNLGEVDGSVNTVSDVLSQKMEARYLKIEVFAVTDNVFCAVYEIDAFGVKKGNSNPVVPSDPASPEDPVETGDPAPVFYIGFTLLLSVFAGFRLMKPRKDIC